jgi:hypothetical protein
MCHKTNTYPADGALAMRRPDPLSITDGLSDPEGTVVREEDRAENGERGIVTGTSGEFA